MKKGVYILLFALMIPFLQSCDEEDDVIGIFTGKEWKLSGIFYDNGKPCYEYWSSAANPATAAESDYSRLLTKKEYFTLKFTGAESDGIASGNFTGKASNANLSGDWSVTSGSRELRMKRQTGSDNEILGRAFLSGINNSYKYSGDYNNLYIYFKEGASERYLAFHVNKE